MKKRRFPELEITPCDAFSCKNIHYAEFGIMVIVPCRKLCRVVCGNPHIHWVFSCIYSALFCQSLGRKFCVSLSMRSIQSSDSLGIPLIQSWEARRTLNVHSRILF